MSSSENDSDDDDVSCRGGPRKRVCTLLTSSPEPTPVQPAPARRCRDDDDGDMLELLYAFNLGMGLDGRP